MADVEMVERVARAIYVSRNGPGAKPWSLLPKAHKAPYLGDARAAIEALREPTEAMGMAGLQAWDPDARGAVSDHLAANPSLWMRPTWQAMIDAILKEGD